ncbi:MAG: anaerobic ribonucleoside triphosphate reductase [Haloplasmataceae bacterium]|jgi:ribonucleoside-triphosphate reductase|nr:anaerobic ribonucleoside triphosphate reductase [Haloplasmataceae bacterium]
MKYIMKRDGRIVNFDESKIYNAILKAQKSTINEDMEMVNRISNDVLSKLNDMFVDNPVNVETVQDLIEKSLIAYGEAEVAKSYILYRAERTRIRESNTRLMKSIHDITFKDSKDNDVKRENANIDGNTAMGTMLKYGSETSKQFYLTHLINPAFSTAHLNGDIHIHDLDFYSLTMTCCQIDLIKLFAGGFSTGNGFLREPNDIRSYASLACIAIQANQNDQHGGQSIPNFDYAMALGVRKTFKKFFRNNLIKILGVFIDVNKNDIEELINSIENKNIILKINNQEFYKTIENELIIKYPNLSINNILNKVIQFTMVEIREATYQAMEALIHNLNTMHSRAGAQVPFSSLNYGTDTSDEGRMVIDCLLDATIKGLGNGETPIFPIQIFKVKEGVNYNKNDINYDLFKKAIYTSGKRLFPNFSFLDAPYNKQYYKEGDYNSEVAYMGCRTRVVSNVDKSKEIVSGRGNLSFTSINLPRLAIKNKDIKQFYIELDRIMELVKNQLLERFEIQCTKKVYNFPFLMGQGVWLDSDKLNYDDNVRDVLKHGTLTIGFIGLAETLKVLTGFHHGEKEDSQKLGLEIISHMRTMCDEYTEKYNLNFSLIATPAEGLSGRFVKMDKKEYGIIEGVTDREYYTNSFHIPVYYKISIFDKIRKEAPYNALTNGGHITYVEVDGDISKNTDAFEKIIRFMHDEGIGYGSVNHPIDRDPICGFNGIINNTCPKCGRAEESIPFERIRRITGYLVGSLDRFNNAKKAEVANRVKHWSKDEN